VPGALWAKQPGLSVPGCLRVVAGVAAVSEVVECRLPAGGSGLVVVGFEEVPVAAVDAAASFEFGRVAEVEGDPDLGGDVASPAADVAEVPSVVEQAGEEGVPGDLLGGLGGDGADAGDLAELLVPHVVPTSFGDAVGDQNDHLGAALARALPVEECGEGVGEIPLEGFGRLGLP